MSQGKKSSDKLIMAKNKNLFLDYGELIFDHRFNNDTLSRAHRLAFDYIKSNGYTLDRKNLEVAHKKTIGVYLREGRLHNSEWSMDRIVGDITGLLRLDKKLVSDLVDIYKLNDHDYWPMGTTRDSLPILAGDRDLHIISNVPHDSLYSELAEHDMLGFFKTFTLSGEVGVRKPHPKIYNIAMERAGSTPKASLFVSHDKVEVEGAVGVGMKGFLAKSLGEIVEALR